MAAATGMVEMAHAHRRGVMRLVGIQRGDASRDGVLVACGEAGSLPALALARVLDLPPMLMPPSPGLAWALGLRMTDGKHACMATRRYLRTCLNPAARE